MYIEYERTCWRKLAVSSFCWTAFSWVALATLAAFSWVALPAFSRVALAAAVAFAWVTLAASAAFSRVALAALAAFSCVALVALEAFYWVALARSIGSLIACFVCFARCRIHPLICLALLTEIMNINLGRIWLPINVSDVFHNQGKCKTIFNCHYRSI